MQKVFHGLLVSFVLIAVLAMGSTALAQEVPVSPTPEAPDLFGAPPRPIQLTPVVRENPIDWNEQLQIDEWIAQPGLAPDVVIYYVQSGVEQVLELKDFQVPEGAVLLFGAVSINLTVEDATGQPISRSFGGGIYGALPSGTVVRNSRTVDGFQGVVNEAEARIEFCYRLAQARAEQWALSLSFPLPEWGEEPCSGEFVVPLDSDRQHGGTLPSGTPVPQQQSQSSAETSAQDAAVVPSFMAQAIESCTVSATNTNIRQEPSTQSTVVGTLNESVTVVTHVIGDDKYTWFQISGGWVRSDVVRREGSCPNVVSPNAETSVPTERQVTGPDGSLDFPAGVSVAGQTITIGEAAFSNCRIERTTNAGCVTNGVVNPWPEEVESLPLCS